VIDRVNRELTPHSHRNQGRPEFALGTAQQGGGSKGRNIPAAGPKRPGDGAPGEGAAPNERNDKEVRDGEMPPEGLVPQPVPKYHDERAGLKAN
jgi:hypothetical protein